MEVMGENVVLESAAERRGKKRQQERKTKKKKDRPLSFSHTQTNTHTHVLYCTPKDNQMKRKAGPR